ncbi:MAG: DUF932 domain-containing protein [Planctomycetota bacterium]
MANLILHCGAHAVDRDDVYATATPEPTASWHPIRHGTLLDLVQDTLAGMGLNIASEAHALTRDGSRFFGLLEVRDNNSHAEYSAVVGVRNAHDKAFSAGIAMGTAVLACDNLCFASDVVLSRKHTIRIADDLPRLVLTAVGKLGEVRHDQDRRIEAYKAKRLTTRTVHDLLVKLVDAGSLPVTCLPGALAQYRQPDHEQYLTDGRRTAWTLHNAVTHVLRGRNLTELPRRTIAMQGMLDRACSLN